MGNRRKAAIQPSDLRPEALCATKIAPGVQFFSEMSVSERDHMTVQDDHDQAESTFVSNGPTAERQGAVTTPGVDRTPCTRPSPQTIFIIILIVINVILIILLGTGAVCSCKEHACPSGWKAYEQKCYYFSDVEKNWTLSQSFCASQKASLAVVESEDEMRFVMGLKGKNSFWIGVSKEPGQRWKWFHGNSSALDVSGNGGNCPYLLDEPTPNFLRCSNEHHFICAKTM
ncbi:C-type lectin domain family 2 member D-like isoform X1 [Podarcis raffonei]|uniref:C-type lectin domain family 2 member D-like isoform X1 n=1 Tax=Podarcis raffonei TaxID=65483 RepID=UPI0023293185|nr:C-type lectin domain family 2 member D-like isoform X1 [Podarcis raffonei]